jgi:hypothetical protein
MTSVGIIMNYGVKKYVEVMFYSIFEVLGIVLIVCFLLITCFGYSFTLQMKAVSSILLDYVQLQMTVLLMVYKML